MFFRVFSLAFPLLPQPLQPPDRPEKEPSPHPPMFGRAIFGPRIFCKSQGINNLEKHPVNFSVNRQACFLPVFGPFFARFGSKSPLFASNRGAILRFSKGRRARTPSSFVRSPISMDAKSPAYSSRADLQRQVARWQVTCSVQITASPDRVPVWRPQPSACK
jgi:hypothetical protein